MKARDIHLLPAAALLGTWALSGALYGSPAEPAQLRPAAPLTLGPVPIDLGDHAIPCVTDWNGDGRKDLLVGYRPADKVAVFLNEGTDGQPVFASFTNLQAAGTDIAHPSAGCGAPAPWVCDYDTDGRRDLLVGTGVEGQVFFYRNQGTDAQPVLATGVRLLVGSSPLTVPARATPYVHDWDEDGSPDLLCGAGDGQVYFFKNIGTAPAPAYAPAATLQVAGAPLDLGDRSAIRVMDWDGDGLKDLVGSASYNVSWCRNVGSHPSPVLQAPVPIKAPVAGSGLVPINTGYRMRLELVDWNDDTVTDLLVGSHDGRLLLYEGYRFALTSLEVASSEKMILRWSSAPFLNYQVLAGPSADAINVVAVTRLPSEGTVTSWTNLPIGSARYFRVQVVP